MIPGITSGGGGFSSSSASGVDGDSGGRQTTGHIFNFGANAGAGTSSNQTMIIGAVLVGAVLLLAVAKKGRK